MTQRMSRFPPQNSIITTIKISRTAYAQLSGQKFHPPRVFPPITEPEGTREWKWKDIGMKIVSELIKLVGETLLESMLSGMWI